MHVQRTGGASVLSSLRDEGIWHEAPRNKLNRLLSRLPVRRDPAGIHFRGHDNLAFVQRRLSPAIFNEYLKVAFVRNPYSWLVSLYKTFRRGPNHRHHPIVAAMSGFGEYIDWEIERNKRHQHIFLLDKNEILNIDFVGRLESLDDDYARLCALLNIDAKPLPHRNANAASDYRSLYTDEIRDKVTHHWQRDIELLGYDFDGNLQPCPLDALKQD